MTSTLVLVLASGLLTQAAAPEIREAAPMPRVVIPFDITRYQTLDKAMPTTIRSATGEAIVGSTGYLGIGTRRNESGQAVVDAVQAGSPAAQIGIKKGDILLQIGTHPVVSPQVFREWLQSYGAGESVRIELQREGVKRAFEVKLAATSRPMKPPGARGILGVALIDGKQGEGVVIDRVTPNTPASEAGLKAGDQVMKLNGQTFPAAEKLTEFLGDRKVGEEVTLSIRREKKDSEHKLTLIPDQTRTRAIPLWKKEVLRVGIVPIEFTDIKHNAAISKADLEKALLGRSGPLPGDTLNDYLNEVSQGKVRLEGKLFDWIDMGKKRGDYIQGSGTTNKTALLTEALDKLTAKDGKDLLSQFDAWIFVYAGGRHQTNRGAIYYPHAGAMNYQRKQLNYLISYEGGSTLAPTNRFAKEALMLLGLPELAARTESIGSEGLGPWCALSNTNTSGRPQHPNPWAKEKLGWLKPTVVDPTVKQRLILSPIETSKECLKVLVRPDGSEYFLLENRRKAGWDSDLPGEGLLIWRVVNDAPILEEAHGVDGPQGPNVHPKEVPFPSPSNHSFTPETTPSSRSPKGGGLPVHITQIQRLPDGRIALQIGYEYR